MVTGKDSGFWRIIFTNHGFIGRYKNQLPEDSTIFVLANDTIPVKVEHNGEAKLVDVGIYWVVRKQRHVKHIPFAWIFGKSSTLKEISPLSHAESDFYFILFNRLYEIITNGYQRIIDKIAKLKALEMYMELIARIEDEIRNTIYTTKADEQVFQDMLTRYKFFLWPGAMMIESQPTLQGELLRRPDFRIQTKEGREIYVEIEPPRYKPFIGTRKSTRLKGALNQISDWRKIIGNNSNVLYMIIIGLFEELTEEEKRALSSFNESQDNLVVVTWEYILENVEKIKEGINKELAGDM
ncbi:hypothetical protein A3L09_03540 [Thermococcus profundus]|uniref:Uncharacterized protein n=1 Tax=Thermococcus profundus TaxID=49899 RepID=A0A2Z2M7K6_THEPR|nr:hypothetical protein A3L09_03540 [Thermococcus profundus]